MVGERFTITGRVLEAESGRPLSGLNVHAFDQDLLRDDPLGQAVTDEAGTFTIQFSREAFQDVREPRPDVYLRVFDASGRRELHSTEARVRHDSGTLEQFEIRIAGVRR